VANLDPALEMGLYRVAQEALNNAAKHADAENIAVSLFEDEQRITLLVSDDGHGFDPASVPAGRAGLSGMAERVQAMKGTLSIRSARGAGTTVQVEVAR
jgi:signal transduction histidine kinase